MSFRLQAEEPAPEGVRRIFCEQIESGIQKLSDRRRNQHKAIHSARQRCKRIRAVLRLVRKDLDGRYTPENHRFRDIARNLSDVRDAGALIEAVDKLSSTCKNQRETNLLRTARKALIAKRQQVTAAEESLAERKAAAVESFREAREQVASWPLSTSAFDLLAPGIQRTYANPRKSFSKAYRAPTDKRFHETRKRVKYHWYQMRVVYDVWPDTLRAYRDSVKTLSDLLGDDHDLTVMRETLLESAEILGGVGDRRGVFELIERRQAELRLEARALGQRIFAEKPANFRKRLGRYWQVWQEEIDLSVSEQSESDVDSRAVA